MVFLLLIYLHQLTNLKSNVHWSLGRHVTLCSIVIRIACGISPSSTSPMHIIYLQHFLGEHIYILGYFIMVCPIALVLYCVDLHFTVWKQRSPFIFPPWAPSTNALFIRPSYNHLTVHLCVTLFFYYSPDC
jgi:hypothetical protein